MSADYRGYTETLATIMTLIKDGQRDLLDVARDLDHKLMDPSGCATTPARELDRVANRQRERLAFLRQEVDRFNL